VTASCAHDETRVSGAILYFALSVVSAVAEFWAGTRGVAVEPGWHQAAAGLERSGQRRTALSPMTR
jgi:hypothetical protein